RRIPRPDGEEESRRTEKKECRHDGTAHAQSLGHPSPEDGAGESTDLAEGEHDADDRGRQSKPADGVDDHDRPHESEGEVGQRVPEQERTEVPVADHVPPTLAELAAPPTGADASTAARPRSAAIITGRLRTRSIQTPAGMPNARVGMLPAVTSSATSYGFALSTRRAVSGNARRVTWLPRALTACALQRRR